jgi:ABC-2 type transport system permease protein
MSDIWIVCRKELKELLSSHGDRRSSLLRAGILSGVFGLVIPLSQRDVWMGTSLPALFFLALPLTIVSGVVIDSFAGERERGTLETLLATRLSNQAILLGKVLAVVAYAWSIALFSLFLSLIGLNLTKRSPGLFVYTTPVLVAGLLGSLLVAGLMAGAGVFISLKARSMRAAQQTLSMAMFVIFMGLGFGLPALANTLSGETARNLQEMAKTVNIWALIKMAVLILVAMDAGILTLAMQRFKRSRLIMD